MFGIQIKTLLLISRVFGQINKNLCTLISSHAKGGAVIVPALQIVVALNTFIQLKSLGQSLAYGKNSGMSC